MALGMGGQEYLGDRRRISPFSTDKLDKRLRSSIAAGEMTLMARLDVPYAEESWSLYHLH